MSTEAKQAESGAIDPAKVPRSPGFWRETWRRYRQHKLGVLALVFVLFLAMVGIASPAIVGTKPVVCKYKGKIYFPAMGYLYDKWENGVFSQNRFRREYSKNFLKELQGSRANRNYDPESWAIWPLIYQDPYRRVKKGEWPNQPENPPGDRGGGPSRYNLFGTTPDGIDVFAQVVHGTRTALIVGFVSMIIAAAIGITVGAIGGYFSGWTDILTSRFVELVMCIPTMVMILSMYALMERTKVTIFHIMVIIGVTNWTSISRLVRGEFLRLRELEYVQAAVATGFRPGWIMFRYILPNGLAPVLVPITFGIANAITLESTLTFLGFGPSPPVASWGNVLNMGRTNLPLWWLILFPGGAVFLTVLAYNVIGETLQEATDPRLRDGTS